MRLFISYRRTDSADVCGRIHDRLRQVFPDIRRDVHALLPGLDFVTQLEEEVTACDVCLVVIGPSWVEARSDRGERRILQAEDFVRIEIRSALERGIPVIPVLVNDAELPQPDQLPEDLRPLLRRHAVQIHPDPDFHPSMDRFIDDLRRLSVKPSDRTTTAAHSVVERPRTAAAVAEILPWAELPAAEKSLVSGLLSHVERGEFARLNMLNAVGAGPRRCGPLLDAVRAFAQGAVKLKLDVSTNNEANIRRDLDACFEALSRTPGLYSTYGDKLRPAILGLVALMVGLARTSAARNEVVGTAREFACRQSDNALVRSIHDAYPA